MGTHSNDHELKIGSTTDGFKLVKNDDGSAMYQVVEEVPNYRNPLSFTQTNWIGGHGQHDFVEPDKYFEGQNIDTTQEGRVFLGPLVTEIDEELPCFVAGTPVHTPQGKVPIEKLSISDSVYSFNIQTRGIEICQVTENTQRTSTELIQIATGSNVVECSPEHPFYVDGNWVKASNLKIKDKIQTFNNKVSISALHKVKKETKIYNLKVDKNRTYFAGADRLLVHNKSDMDSNPVCFCWFPATSEWLCATSGEIYRYDVGSNGKWTEAATAVTGVTDLKVFGAYVFAARGHSTAYSYSTDGDTWTASGLTDDKAVKFFVAPNPAGTADVLWKFDTPNELKNNTDGTGNTTQWSSAAYIGDTANNITNIFLVNDNLMISKTDNLWHYDSDGGIHPLRPDLKHNRSTDNFKYITEWQGGIYHSEIDGMGEITSYNAYEPMGPLFAIDDISKRGDIVGLASDKDWIYAAIYDGTNYWIYKGREVRKGNELKWEWCPWIYQGASTIATIAVCQHSATDRRLWFGRDVNTAYVTLSDDPTADSAARFCAAGFLRMSYEYGSDPYWDKLWQSAVIETTGGASGETVQIKYRDDTDTSATECIAAHSTNGVHEVNFTAALANKRIQFEIHLASDTNTTTPEVSFFQARGIEKPTTVRIHEAYYKIGDRPSDRAKTIRTLLRAARTSTTLVKFADLRYGQKTSGTSSGDYVWCVMQPGYPKEVEIKHEKGRQPELAIMVRLQEVSFTIS